jgi:hypothetical protein
MDSPPHLVAFADAAVGLTLRYEPLIVVLGRMTDAPRGEWSSWSDGAPRHSPPLLRLSPR